MTSDPRRDRWWVASACATSVALRLRFLATPLTVDEAGALVVARSWSHGARLYTDVFIDRPQGVLLAYQQWTALLGSSAASIRLLAVLAGVSVVVGAAVAARAISGSWRAGAVAAWLVAVISSSAAIEGYAANGELLAGAVTVPAMAIGALVVARRIRGPWMAVAGALAAAGITVKQSGLDVGVALGAWLAIAAACRWRPRREVAKQLAWLALGACVVLGATIAHGATLGWDAYRYAMYGFRVQSRSALAGPQLPRLALTVLVATPLLGPAVALATRRLRAMEPGWRNRVRPEHVLGIAWAIVALGSFVAGGNYHRHYWIQLTFPVSVLAALALTAGPASDADQQPRRLARTVAVAVALPLAISLVLVAAPGLERDPRVDQDLALTRWLEHHRTSATDELLPLCASVTFTADAADADRLPVYPYLWVDHVRFGRGGVPRLIELLEGPDRPEFLALHQPARTCDPSGRLQATIDRRYRARATVAGVAVLEARG